MQFIDRQTKYQGRKKIIKVDANNNKLQGQPEIYVNIENIDINNDDDIIVEGTPMSAENLNKGNWRDDNSLSFAIMEDNELPTINDEDDETKIVTKENGEVFVLRPTIKGGNFRLDEKRTKVKVNNEFVEDWDADTKLGVNAQAVDSAKLDGKTADEYTTAEQMTNELSNKLDKVTGNQRVYILNSSGEHTSLRYAATLPTTSVNSFPIRKSETHAIEVGTPTLDNEATNKSYVDTAVYTETMRATNSENDIKAMIPNQANANNQLADKAFVNSSIQNLAARFITSTATGNTQWDSLAQLGAGDWYNQGVATTPTQNDYAMFNNTDGSIWRAMFDGTNWIPEYKLNDTPFTASQIAAINSEITLSKVAEISQKYLKPSTGIPKTDLETPVQTSLSKADTALQSSSIENMAIRNANNNFLADQKVNGNVEATTAVITPKLKKVNTGGDLILPEVTSGQSKTVATTDGFKTINSESIAGSGNISLLAPKSIGGSANSGIYRKVGRFPLTAGIENAVAFKYSTGNHTRAYGECYMLMNSNNVLTAQQFAFYGGTAVQFYYAPDPNNSGYMMIYYKQNSDAWVNWITPLDSNLIMETSEIGTTAPTSGVAFTVKDFANYSTVQNNGTKVSSVNFAVSGTTLTINMTT